jgi:hypothetical protein
MVIAIVSYQTVEVLGDGGVTGTPPTYHLQMSVIASDGPLLASQSIDLRIPAGTHRAQFNKLIADAAKTYVDSQNGWTIDPKDIYFQSFDNGA